jgi:small subunit ribosomal protein S4e
MAHMKKIAMPKNWPVRRKDTTFIVRPRGPHKFKESIPLLIIIRDMLRLGNNSRESKKIAKAGKILINNRPVKDIKFTIGIFDKISIQDIGKYYELGFENKKLVLKEINKEKSLKKVCKIIRKKILNKNKIQMGLHGGRTILIEKEKIKVGDSVVLNLENNKIEKILPIEKGANCVIIRGKNTGKTGRIIELEEGRKKSAFVEGKDGKIKVYKRNIWIIE